MRPFTPAAAQPTFTLYPEPDLMRRIFNILLGALAMLAVALLSAFLTLRLAIHGREVVVPDLSGETITDAAATATRLGLNVNLENRFYSTTVPAGRILAQSPQPGTKVRRQWTLRITESLGPQRVSVPNVIGQTERAAAVNIRRLSLELGTVAYIPAPGPPGIVLTQSPTPNATGIDGPRISLLVSEAQPDQAPGHAPEEAADTAAEPTAAPATQPDTAASKAAVAHDAIQPTTEAAAQAYVMPNLIGLTLAEASSKVSAMGLHISSIEAKPATIPPVASVSSASQPATQPIAPIAPITLANTVVAQHPDAGQRVSAADRIHITLSR